MKLVSSNVNGIRAAYKKGFSDFVSAAGADILMLQEVKAEREQLEFELPQQYYVYWNSAVRKGYSGTAILSREKSLDCIFGLGSFDENEEGRVITLEFVRFYLVCVYTPNSKDGLKRLPYRQEWDKIFANHLMKLDADKPVIAAGDFNVAHNEIDLKNPESNHMNAGFSDEERAGFSVLLSAGFSDTYRALHPDKVEYSWFSYRTRARERNAGWRIDYFVVSNRIMGAVKGAGIDDSAFYSDHLPIWLDFDMGLI